MNAETQRRRENPKALTGRGRRIRGETRHFSLTSLNLSVIEFFSAPLR
jgi:hypothetical protein